MQQVCSLAFYTGNHKFTNHKTLGCRDANALAGCGARQHPRFNCCKGSCVDRSCRWRHILLQHCVCSVGYCNSVWLALKHCACAVVDFAVVVACGLKGLVSSCSHTSYTAPGHPTHSPQLQVSFHETTRTSQSALLASSSIGSVFMKRLLWPHS